MTRRLTVKKEIRTLGVDLCNPRRLIGAIVRGGAFLDGVVVFPSKPIPNSRSMASAITAMRFFPELRLIMVHGPEKRLEPRIIERLTKLPVIQINSSREGKTDGYKPYRIGRKLLGIKSRLPLEVIQEILSTTWVIGRLPEPVRIAHLLGRSRLFRQKPAF